MPSEYRAIWGVLGGGTGYSVFHADLADDATDAQEFADAVQDFFSALANVLPTDVIINFDSEVVNLAEDGTLVGVFPVTVPTQVTGSGTGSYSRAAGARIDWTTGVIVGGRRLTGRTYLVPIVGSAFDADGVLTTTVQTGLQTAAQDFIADLTAAGIVLRIWSRKNASSSVVIDASVPAKGAILRSRRD